MHSRRDLKHSLESDRDPLRVKIQAPGGMRAKVQICLLYGEPGASAGAHVSTDGSSGGGVTLQCDLRVRLSVGTSCHPSSLPLPLESARSLSSAGMETMAPPTGCTWPHPFCIKLSGRCHLKMHFPLFEHLHVLLSLERWFIRPP